MNQSSSKPLSQRWGNWDLFRSIGLGLMILLGNPSIMYAETDDYLLLQKGALKLMRAGQSRLLWQPGLKLVLMPGDRLHNGSDTRVTQSFKQGSENIELYSHAFLEVDGISEEQRSVALLVGKGNFDLPPAPELFQPVGTGDMQIPNNQSKKKETEIFSVVKPEEDTDIDSQNNQKANGLSETTPSKVQELLGKLGKFSKRKLSEQKLSKKRTKGLVNLGEQDLSKPSGLKLRKKRFMVRTISAVVGVRGTEFVVAAVGDTTNVLTVTGQVSMASTELPDHEVVIPTSSVSRVTAGKVPSEPVEVPPAEQQQIVKAENPGGFAGVEFGPAESIEAVKEQEKEDESDVLEQLDEIEAIQDLLDSVEDATSSTRTMILKTNIIEQ